jgi:hypothetical protein
MATESTAIHATAHNGERSDPALPFWRFAWIAISAITAVPLFIRLNIPLVLPYKVTLVIHELSGFIFFGHTLFSNIWCMRVRQTQSYEAGFWANQFIRRLAIGITLPTSVLTPLAGMMLIGTWGGLQNNAWAYEAYLCFWVMAFIQLIPDIIVVWRDKHKTKPKHGMMGGALRGSASTILTIYIIILMGAKTSLLAHHFL